MRNILIVLLLAWSSAQAAETIVVMVRHAGSSEPLQLRLPTFQKSRKAEGAPDDRDYVLVPTPQGQKVTVFFDPNEWVQTTDKFVGKQVVVPRTKSASSVGTVARTELYVDLRRVDKKSSIQIAVDFAEADLQAGIKSAHKSIDPKSTELFAFDADNGRYGVLVKGEIYPIAPLEQGKAGKPFIRFVDSVTGDKIEKGEWDAEVEIPLREAFLDQLRIMTPEQYAEAKNRLLTRGTAIPLYRTPVSQPNVPTVDVTPLKPLTGPAARAYAKMEKPPACGWDDLRSPPDKKEQ